MCIKYLQWRLVSLLAIRLLQRPDVRFLVFAPAGDISAIIAETRSNLAAVVLIAPELELQTLITPVVESDTRIVTCDQHLGIARSGSIECRDARDLAALGILTSS